MMGFRLNCSLEGMEYRGKRDGVSKKTGKPWMSLVLEDANAEQLVVSVPGDMLPEVQGLSLFKGDMLDLDVRAVAYDGEDGGSYIQLLALPRVLDKAGF